MTVYIESFTNYSLLVKNRQRNLLQEVIMLEIKQLQVEEVREIYKNHLVHDFPPEEVKPLALIEKLMKQGVYPCYGLYEEQNLVSYAFFCKKPGGTCILIDFLAVIEKYRSYGYGSKFLDILKRELKEYGGIIFEVESGKSAVGAEELNICQRRIDFYHRNGVRDTKYSCHYFGVDMNIMYLPLETDLEDEVIYSELDNIYHVMHNKEVYEENIKLYSKF